tara:strand:+ start:137 stop:772 length:636 start_codon:yes stop_codon:yes gene_type:complete
LCNNKELNNFTLLIDEGDLTAPTSSNDELNKNDEPDTTTCEKLITTITNKNKYNLYITGSAHILLYNTTTKLDNSSCQRRISKFHKMKRTDDYYGIFNKNINYDTNVENWWSCKDNIQNKKTEYSSYNDYNKNIKKIIENIIKRKNTNKYSSLLLNEEKQKNPQAKLAKCIMKDFDKNFIIILNGDKFRFYFDESYDLEIKALCQKEYPEF